MWGRCGGVSTLEDNDPCGTLFFFIPSESEKTMTEPLTLLIVEDETLLAGDTQNISAIFALSRYGWRRAIWRRRE